MSTKLRYSLLTFILFAVGIVLGIHHYSSIKMEALERMSEKEFSENMLPKYQNYILALAGEIYEDVTVNPEDHDYYLKYVKDYKEELVQTPIKYYAYNEATNEISTNFESFDYESLINHPDYYTLIHINFNSSSYPVINEGGISSVYEQGMMAKKLNAEFKSRGRLMTNKMDALRIKDCIFVFAIEKTELEAFGLENLVTYNFYLQSQYAIYALIRLLGVIALLVVGYLHVIKVDILEELQPYRFIKCIYLEFQVFLLPILILLSGVGIGIVALLSMGNTLPQVMIDLGIHSDLLLVAQILLWFIYLYSISMVIFMMKYIYKSGVMPYLKKHTFILRSIRFVKRSIWDNVVKYISRIIKATINYLFSMDFNDRYNRSLILITLISVIVMIFASSWYWFSTTVIIILIYHIVVFVVANHKLNQMKADYLHLLLATRAISNGKFDFEIKGDYSYFNSLKKALSHLKEGFKNAVDEEVKSQRMKTELVTNVSHDLKTPLTSMMTYVDLLKSKDLDEKSRDEYIEVLDRNTRRLKTLIEDLFEISKVNSGNVDLDLMDVDLGSLILQTYYECKEAIDESNIDLRFMIPEGKHVCKLDSRKTYRVFENLFMNISKYTLSQTRAYIVLEDKTDSYIITFKNISKYELDFDVEEITERFVRGDKSRNSQGSGLGLAIVKSFVELQQGTFKIETDGDLFKAIIEFKKRV